MNIEKPKNYAVKSIFNNLKTGAFMSKKYVGLQPKNFFRRNLFLIISFFVPALILYTVFAIFKVAPFGDSQILVTDLWHQYYPFLCDFQDKLKSGGSLLYSWKVGLGTNYVALMSYYLLSPLNFFSVFVPNEWLREFLAVAVALKVGFAGLFFSIFAKITCKRNDISLCIFSAMYALCSFIMGYYWNVIWLDTVALLPLVVAGTYSVLKYRKFKLYVISLALSVLANYYIGLFTCIFVLLICIFYQLSNFKGFKNVLINIASMAAFTVIAIGLTAFVTLPAFFALQNTHSAGNEFPKQFTVNIGGTNDFTGVLVGIKKIISNSIQFIEPNVKDGELPNVYCGILSVVLTGIFFTNKKINLKERLSCGVLTLFLVLSCVIQQLNFVWHGMHVTNMLPYRFSFLISFLLVYMAFRTFMYLDGIKIANVFTGLIIFAAVICCCISVQQTKAVIMACVFGGLYLIWIALFSLKLVTKNVICIAFSLIVMFEMCYNVYYGVDKVTVTQKVFYPKNGADVETVVDEMKNIEKNNVDLYRAETTAYQTLNDGALNNYNGISQFSSMANSNVTSFMEKFGTSGWVASNRYTYQTSSPVTNLFLNLKYLISRDGDFVCDRYFDKTASSGNVKLLKNAYYLPMGFLANHELSLYSNEMSTAVPFDNQNRIFRLATGIDENVYQYLDTASDNFADEEGLTVSKKTFGHYSYSSYTDRETNIVCDYYLPEGINEGTVCVYANVTNQDNLKIFRNDIELTKYSYYNKCPFIVYAGDFKQGDKITVKAKISSKSSGDATIYCALLKDDVFKQGYNVLSKSTLKASKVTDTKIEGTIDCDRDGLFYTSIPYEDGWSAYVDGKKCDIKAFGDAFVTFDISKGTHTVELRYLPNGFTLGVIVSLVCLLIFVVAVLLFRKKSVANAKDSNENFDDV